MAVPCALCLGDNFAFPALGRDNWVVLKTASFVRRI